MGHYKDRYRIVGHMESYDQFSFVPFPYLMFRTRPNHTSAVINTDRYGWRYSIAPDKSRVSVEGISDYDNVGIVLGGSAAFGWGATSDDKTISSLLNRLDPGTTWLNMGGCTYQSFQELVSLLMFVPLGKISRIVLYSGVNGAFLTLFEHYKDPNVPFFFKYSDYWTPIEECAKQTQGERFLPVLRNFIRKMRGYPQSHVQYPPNPLGQAEPDIHKRIDAGMERATRDINTIAYLSRSAGFEVDYFFQPCIMGESKKLTDEELEITQILDSLYQKDNPMKRLGDVVPRFADGIGSFCKSEGVGFDNLQPMFLGDEWLFVDRVHSTDKGYEKAALAIHQYINRIKS